MKRRNSEILTTNLYSAGKNIREITIHNSGTKMLLDDVIENGHA